MRPSSTRSSPATTCSRKTTRSCRPGWRFPSIRLLTEHLPNLVDYQFTAQMEDLLDEISRHEKQHVEYLQQFFFGDERAGPEIPGRSQDQGNRCPGRQPLLDRNAGRWNGCRRRFSCGWASTARSWSRVSGGRAFPTALAPDELTLEKAVELLDRGQQIDEPLGICPDTHKPVFVKQGRFGPYVQLGTTDDEDKKNASLLRGMEVSDVDLQTALQLLSLAQNTRPASANARAGRGLQRPLRPLCQMRSGNAFAAGRRLAVDGHLGDGARTVGAAQDARSPARPPRRNRCVSSPSRR